MIPKKAFIIINPASGSSTEEAIRTIEETIKELRWKTEIHYTTLKKDAGALAQQARKKGITRIIICGGDGTVRSALYVFVKTKLTLGIIPIGTGNIFAKNLNIPQDIRTASKIALQGKPSKVDVGKANEHYFVLIAGMGLDVDMMNDAKKSSKSTWGILAYIWSGLQNITKQPRTYKLIIDKKKNIQVRAKTVMVANIGKTQAGLKIVPKAHQKSGDLRIAIIKTQTLYTWLELLFNLLRGKPQESQGYDYIKGYDIKIVPLGKPQPYECDGDTFAPTKKLDITIYPASLNVLVPG